MAKTYFQVWMSKPKYDYQKTTLWKAAYTFVDGDTAWFKWALLITSQYQQPPEKTLVGILDLFICNTFYYRKRIRYGGVLSHGGIPKSLSHGQHPWLSETTKVTTRDPPWLTTWKLGPPRPFQFHSPYGRNLLVAPGRTREVYWNLGERNMNMGKSYTIYNISYPMKGIFPKYIGNHGKLVVTCCYITPKQS